MNRQIKLHCDLIRDLLPLYHDKACSQASREAVESHVHECEACRESLEKFNAPLLSEPSPGIRGQEAGIRFMAVRKRLVRRTALIMLAIFVAVALLVTAAASLYTELEREYMLAYDQISLRAEAGINGEVVIFAERPTRFVQAQISFYQVDGRDIAVISMMQSGMRRYFDFASNSPPVKSFGYGTQLFLHGNGSFAQPYFSLVYEPELWNPSWQYPGELAAIYYRDANGDTLIWECE